MAGNITKRVGAWQQMLSTELNALGAGVAKVQVTGTNPAYDNGDSGNKYFWGDFELQVTYGSAPTAFKTIDLYIVPLSSDGGTTYEDASATGLPWSLYVGSWTIFAVTTLQRLLLRDIPLPPGKFLVALLNGSDVAMAATLNLVKFLPHGEAYT